MKMVLLPLALILLFGGGFVAVNKPFNPKAATVVIGLGVGLLLIALASGWPKWIGFMISVLLIGLLVLRRFRS